MPAAKCLIEFHFFPLSSPQTGQTFRLCVCVGGLKAANGCRGPLERETHQADTSLTEFCGSPFL